MAAFKSKSKKKSSTKRSKSINLNPSAIMAAAADKASSFIAKAEKALPLDCNLTEKQRHTALGLQIVSTDALAAAVGILETDGKSFPTYDLQEIEAAHRFETSMKDVLARATTLVTKIETSILKRRVGAAEQALGLYASLKAAGRTDGNFLTSIDRMANEVSPRRRARSRKAAAHAQAPQPTAPAAVTHTPAATPVITNGASAPSALHS